MDDKILEGDWVSLKCPLKGSAGMFPMLVVNKRGNFIDVVWFYGDRNMMSATFKESLCEKFDWDNFN